MDTKDGSCRYSLGDWRCRREPVSQDGLCIFHTPDKNECPGEFSLELEKELEQCGSGELDLRGAHFPEGTVFVFPRSKGTERCQCNASVDLREAKFDGEISFGHVDFRKAADFRGARFAGDALFKGVRFERRVKFDRAKFDGAALFSGAVFDGDASFAYAAFAGLACFDALPDEVRARFKRRVTFRHALFRGSCLFEGRVFSGELDFRCVGLERPEDVFFNGCDLRRARLAGTGLSRVRFVGVRWLERGFYTTPRRCLFEEEALRGNLEEGYRNSSEKWWKRAPESEQLVGLEGVRELYRNLKVSYESARDYAIAGDWHVGDMELRDLERPLWRRRLSLRSLYGLLSGYGERHGIALVWWLALVLAVIIVRGQVDGVWLLVLPQVVGLGWAKSETSKLLAAALGIAGPVQTALLVLSVRNYFRR